MERWQYSTIFFLFVIALIPVFIHDVYATIFGISIPEGASDPKQPYHYWPSEVTVTLDDKLQWYNLDSTTHTVTSGSFLGGPDGIFNSGILEPKDFFIYQPVLADIGKLSYYCTLHPWMNGIITILDPEGLPVGRVVQTGSIEAASHYVDEAQRLVERAKGFSEESNDDQAAISYNQAAISFHNAALEFSLLDDYDNAAKYYHEAGLQHNNAALHFEKVKDYTKSVIEHHHAGIQHHFAGVQFEMMGDHKSSGKHFAEALIHKGMAKFGSDYILPPKHQIRWLADPSDVTCKEGLDIVIKSTTKEPACVKPSSVETLIERGWAIVP